MAARLPAERALARSFTGIGTRFAVLSLEIVPHQNRSSTLVYRLAVVREGRPEERWEVRLPWADKSDADLLTSSAPEQRRLDMLVSLVRCALEEWWETKGFERRSAKLGRRLP